MKKMIGVVAAFAAAVIGFAASAAPVWEDGTWAAEDVALTPPERNLVRGRSPDDQSGNFGQEGNGKISVLTDGSVCPTSDKMSVVALGSKFAMTWRFDGLRDIRGVRLFSQWGSGSRCQINIASITGTGADGKTVTICGEHVYKSGKPRDRSYLSDGDGGSLGLVSSITITFGDLRNGFCGYSELEVIGGLPKGASPTPRTPVDLSAGTLSAAESAGPAATDYALRALQVNRLDEPGDVTSAVFSWKADSSRKGARQTAYRLVVGKAWDSGWVKSSDSIEIPYRGSPLQSATRYGWRVEVRDETGAIARGTSSFTTALLESNAWERAQFITTWRKVPYGGETNRASIVVRRVYTNEADVVSAMWFTTGCGVYETYVNGKAFSREFLKPGHTQAIRRRQAIGEDVTAVMRRGKGEANEFAALVTDGWWRDGTVGMMTAGSFAGILVVRFADGTERRYPTDTTWSAACAGPVNTADIFNGEVYDARREGWTGEWEAAARQPQVPWQAIRPRQGPPLRLREDLTLKPAGIAFPRTVKAGETLILDFGQNAAAVPRFTWRAKAGVKVIVKTAEMLNDDGDPKRGNDGPPGTLMRKNLRSALSRVIYWFKDGERTVYRPNFTYFGYRYISVEADGDVELQAVESVPVCSISAALETGRIVTGDKSVNRLFENCLWGLRSNYVSIPTDCPQRDERRGWAGDAQVFAPAAAYLCDASAFLDKWLDDMCDLQYADGDMPPFAPWRCKLQQAEEWVTPKKNPNDRNIAQFGWDDAVIFIPWEMQLRFGDRRMFSRHRAAIDRYFDFANATKYGTPEKKFQWGDWLATVNVKGPYHDYLGFCHLVLDAETLHRLTGEEKYRQAADAARADARTRFVEQDGLILSSFRESQTALAFALKAGIPATAEARQATVKLLLDSIHRKNLLNTGFLGTGIIMDVVTDIAGAPETAYDLLLHHNCPGWLYSVDQGATTMWERWNSYTKKGGFANPGMNSFNHYAFGAVSAWMFSTMGGIRPDPSAPGYRHFFLQPHPDRRVGRCETTFDSPYGVIRSAWHYGKDSKWTWTFTIPPNASATVRLPDGAEKEYPAGTYEL